MPSYSGSGSSLAEKGITEMTTATLRNQAYEATRRLEWSLAAELYDRAADLYPAQVGQLAKADIANLRQRAAELRRFAESQ